MCILFKIAGFPKVLGIDCTFIKVRTPAHKIKSTYVNRHDIPSITLQGICDARKRFVNTFTGIPSKIHDARVLKLSDIQNCREYVKATNITYSEMEPMLYENG